MPEGIRTSDDDVAEAIEYVFEGNFVQALQLLTRAVAFDSANETAYSLWVACHIDLGRMQRAIELADAGLLRGFAPVGLNIQKARALRELGEFDAAAQAARTALEIDPVSTEAMLSLAETEIARERFDDAIAIYQDALKNDPADAGVHFALLNLLNDLDRNEMVIASARDFLRKFDRDDEVLTMLGHAYMGVGQHRRADRAFRDAAQLAPDVVAHHVNVVMLALVTRNEASCTAYLDKLVERDEELANRVAHEAELLVDRMRHEAGDESE